MLRIFGISFGSAPVNPHHNENNQSTQDHGQHGVGNIFHGLADASAVQNHGFLLESLRGAAVIVLGRSVSINIIRDGVGVGLGYRTVDGAIGVDPDIPVVHINQENRTAVSVEILLVNLLGVALAVGIIIHGGEEHNMPVFGDGLHGLHQLRFLFRRQQIRKVQNIGPVTGGLVGIDSAFD